ncbi:hypothetical protein FRB96_000478 [Tulasnella sp. 330]|nr:hypothetical protein FRB96_000478 [Tulasnella sp. 330]KAG8883053.1 hypothetical protein FRB97_007318 [Tulasnella sp. 331]
MASYPRDIVNFQLYYPEQGQQDYKRLDKNLLFYMNERKCLPDGLLIEELHDQWQGEYSILEQKHGFIQWIFPIREHGVNQYAHPLQPHEIIAMRVDGRIQERLYTSYKLMLNFYGMRLDDEETGRLSRSSDHTERYANLVRSPHNYLRITRILKSLSELGLEHLNIGFLLFVLAEQSEHGQLNTRGIKSSMDNFWVGCIRDDLDREAVETLVERVRYHGLRFTREYYQRALEARELSRSHGPELEEQGAHDDESSSNSEPPAAEEMPDIPRQSVEPLG